MSKREILHGRLMRVLVLAMGVICFFGFWRSYRQQGELLAQASRFSTLSNVFEVARVGYWEWNQGTGEFSWSCYAWQVRGQSAETEETFELWAATIHPDDRDRVLARLHECENTGHGYCLEYRILRGDGTVGNVIEIADLDERAGVIVGICADENTHGSKLLEAKRDAEVAHTGNPADGAGN